MKGQIIDHTKTNDLSPDEKFEAITELKRRMENNFLELGDMLSQVKRQKIYSLKGYENFKDFIQDEYGLAIGLANRLIRTYEVFINQHNFAEHQIKEIGFDKLNCIIPMLKNAQAEDVTFWINEAEEGNLSDLKTKITEFKGKAKKEGKTLKQVLIEQWQMKFTQYFGCSTKELQFRLALVFSDYSPEAINEFVNQARTKLQGFEEDPGEYIDDTKTA